MKQLIRYLVMDVDGTLTDGKIYMGSNGEVMKAFNVKDGYGIHEIAIPAGITPVIITGRCSAITEKRCQELGITELYQGIRDKLNCLLTVTEDLSAVAYIGDDLNDLPCAEAIKASGGLIGCPADAEKGMQLIADFISSKNGGDGAVREFITWLTE